MTNMSIDGIDTISKTSVLLKKILNTEINDPEKPAFVYRGHERADHREVLSASGHLLENDCNLITGITMESQYCYFSFCKTVYRKIKNTRHQNTCSVCIHTYSYVRGRGKTKKETKESRISISSTCGLS